MLIIPVNHEAVTPPSGSTCACTKGIPPGARASRPHNAWHSLGQLPATWSEPATAPWLSFGLAAAVTADVVAACKAARKLSDHQRDSMRAGRPRSRGYHSPLEGESQKPSRRRRLMRPADPGAGAVDRFFMNIDAARIDIDVRFPRGADSGNDPVRASRLLQDLRVCQPFPEKSCASASASMLIIPVNHEAGRPPPARRAHAQKGLSREPGVPPAQCLAQPGLDPTWINRQRRPHGLSFGRVNHVCGYCKR